MALMQVKGSDLKRQAAPRGRTSRENPRDRENFLSVIQADESAGGVQPLNLRFSSTRGVSRIG